MGEEEVLITTTGNQQQLPNDFDGEHYYIPSTQSTPNIIGNADDAIQEE